MSAHQPVSAHALLIEQHAFLRRLARSLVSDPERAEDLAQDVAVLALRHPPRPGSSPRAWLARVLRNRAVSVARSESRRRDREALAPEPAPQPTPPELEARLRVQRAVIEAVARLEEPYRSAILLRYDQDLSPTAIAERLGVPVATVKTRLARALERLRADLDARDRPGSPTWSAVLLLGLTDVRPSAAGAALAAGGAVLGAKLVGICTAVAVATVVGGWWVLREPSVSPVEGAASVGSRERAIAPKDPDPVERQVGDDVQRELRTSVVEAEASPQSPAPAPDWSLELTLRGWEASDSGAVRIEVGQSDSKEPALVREVVLAERIVFDVGPILREPEGRPDRLTLFVDHPEFLPVRLGVLVPQELLAVDVVRGRLAAAVDLERTSALLHGAVEFSDPAERPRVRVAMFRIDDGVPAAQPLEVAQIDASGRYRLRVGDSPAWIVVAWLFPEPGASRARPASRRLDGPLRGEVELEPLVLDRGAIVDGRVVASGGATPSAGSIRIQALPHPRLLDGGLAWDGQAFALRPDDQEWRADGSFRFEGLAPGPFRLQMASLGMSEEGIPKLQVQDTQTAAVDVTAPARDLVVPFERIQALLEVLGDEGPVARAQVLARWILENGSRGAGTTADEFGRVVLELGSSDSVELEGTDAVAGQGRLSISAADLVPNQRVELRLSPRDGPECTLRLRLSGSVVGMPSDGGMNAYLYDLEQVPPPMLSVWLSSVPFSTKTGSVSMQPLGPKVSMRFEAGVWTIEGLPRTRLLLRFLPSNPRRETKWLVLGDEFEVDLTQEEGLELDWEPRPGGFLRLDLSALGELASAQLKRPDGGLLTLSYLRSTEGNVGFSVESLASRPGLYDVHPTLEAGTYRLEVRLRDGTRRELPVPIVAGRVTDLIVRPDDL